MEDIILTTRIPGAKVEYAREALLARYPKDNEGLTDKKHVEGIIRALLVNIIGGYWKEKAMTDAVNNFTEDSDVVE